MDAKNLGKKLKACRARRGLTQEQCAERAGITTRYLADIERGDKVPRLETFITILNVLCASADEVLQDSLLVGYREKSSDIMVMLDGLPPRHRAAALAIFERTVKVLQEL